MREKEGIKKERDELKRMLETKEKEIKDWKDNVEFSYGIGDVDLNISFIPNPKAVGVEIDGNKISFTNEDHWYSFGINTEPQGITQMYEFILFYFIFFFIYLFILLFLLLYFYFHSEK
jgi:hypothetical protein